MNKFDRVNYLNSASPIKKNLLRLFPKNSNLIILDIGGCEGEESIRYSKLFPNSSIFIFEPLPANQILIKNNINKYLKGIYVQLIPKAVSDRDGFENLYISSGQPKTEVEFDWDFGNKSSSLLSPQVINNPKWLRFVEKIEVQTVTLNSFFEKNSIKEVDFIHMDVQGAELKVLYGAKEKIKIIKTIWLEVADIELYKNQPLRRNIENFMKGNNFHLIKSDMNGKLGDQFYVNKDYFDIFSFFKRKVFFKKKTWR